ncbi:hypothetical protein J4E08_00695 [Sagittula sp. NFXS13]|uniref:hypothetical protein n=1 Tax=Sagittula sp. NFXS13 TaxID=2819095 RepID=UPI0032DE64C4
MHALLLDSRPDRLDRLQIAFLEAGIHVTGSGNLAVAECCLRRAMVDVLLMDETAAGGYAGDIAAMAERRNLKVVTLMLAGDPDAMADACADRIKSLHGVMEHDSDPGKVARMARAALGGRGGAKAAGPAVQAAKGAAADGGVLQAKAHQHAQKPMPKPQAAQPAPKAARTVGDGYPALKVHPALAAQRAAEAERAALAEHPEQKAQPAVIHPKPQAQPTGPTPEEQRMEAARQVLEQRHARAEQLARATPTLESREAEQARIQAAHEERLVQARAIARQRALDYAAATRAAQTPRKPEAPPMEHHPMPKKPLKAERIAPSRVQGTAAPERAPGRGQAPSVAPLSRAHDVPHSAVAGRATTPPAPSGNPAIPASHAAVTAASSNDPVPLHQAAKPADSHPIFQSSRRRLVGVTTGALMSA